MYPAPAPAPAPTARPCLQVKEALSLSRAKPRSAQCPEALVCVGALSKALAAGGLWRPCVQVRQPQNLKT